MVLGGRGAGGLAVPGSIVTTVGLILLYQNYTNHWESWAYAWGLIPMAVGIGLMINGAWSFRPGLVTQGRRLAITGLGLFLVFGAFFEVLIFRGFIGYAQWLWPVLLIVLGLFLLLRRGRDSF
jgi:cadmium resistance protein CadD (predicted permease)